MTVKVIHVVRDWDMRLRHRLRDSRRAWALRRGQVLVAFNRDRSMARVIDCVGAIHDYYANEGEEYDVDLVARRIQEGLYVDLDVGRHESTKGTARLRTAA